MTSTENQPRPARERGAGGPRNFRRSRPKVCQFCVDKVKHIDYKEVGRLRQMMTEHGKMKSRRVTGTCAEHQRKVAVAIKRARQIALLPFMAE